jgi:hypothetical protein
MILSQVPYRNSSYHSVSAAKTVQDIALVSCHSISLAPPAWGVRIVTVIVDSIVHECVRVWILHYRADWCAIGEIGCISRNYT